MSDERDKEIVFRPLYRSPIVGVHDYCCHIERSGPGAEEVSDANNIVLMRHGAFARHFGRRTTTADVNQAVFFSRESTYRVSHPADCGDRGTVFAASARSAWFTSVPSRFGRRVTPCLTKADSSTSATSCNAVTSAQSGSRTRQRRQSLNRIYRIVQDLQDKS